MPRYLHSPARLLHKTWRAGHPFPHRLSSGRRWGIFALFVVLSLVIASYIWITRAARVREMAQGYLSQLVGGRVEVGKATLSIFQGLKLEDVRLYAKSPLPQDHAPLFEAQTVLVNYNPAALIAGRIEGTRIIATGPRVRLIEDVQTGHWNHEGLRIRTRPPNEQQAQAPLVLPEIVLRNAHVQYSQFDGKTLRSVGVFAMEGQLSALTAPDAYRFNLQTRGENEGRGPSIDGTAIGGEIHASISNFVFDSDIKAMLPELIRRWCEEHNLAGTLDVPELTYRYQGTTPAFRATIALHDVTMQVLPEEWLGKSEVQRLGWAHQVLSILAASDGPGPGDFWSQARVGRLTATMVPWPITLQHADGDFVFTEQGIDLEIKDAKIEDNTFKITGHVGGYAANSAAHVQIANADNTDLVIPPDPRYVNAMPAGLREIYDRFRPQGHCRLQFDLLRARPGGNILSNGRIELLSGQGIFENFLYPVRLTGGTLLVKSNPVTGQQTLIVSHITGHGIAGGPNADADLEVDGWMSPLGPEAQVQIVVSGHGLHGEPALFHALPHGTQKALADFDAPGTGQFPTFAGDFQTHVVRYPTRVSHWTIETDIHVTDASGIPTFFPYLLEHARGDLAFRGDTVRITNGHMRHGGATIDMSGLVSWSSPHSPGQILRPALPKAGQPPHDEPSHVRPDLVISGHNVPIDDALIAALPEDRRESLVGLGLSGMLDLTGRIMPPRPPAPTAQPAAPPAAAPKYSVALDLDLTLRDGAAHPRPSSATTAPASSAPPSTAPASIATASTTSPSTVPASTATLTNLAGTMKLTEQSLAVHDLTGHLGPADMTGHGTVDWSAGPTTLDMQASAANLKLNSDLYQILPAAAQRAWDSVHPAGTADADLTFSGPISSLADHSPTPAPTTVPSIAPTLAPTTAHSAGALVDASDSVPTIPPSAPSGSSPTHYSLVLLPKSASALPQAAPYQLDNVTGKLTVHDGAVTLENITARHGNATLAVAGTGTADGVWDLALKLAGAPADADLLRAVPAPIADLLQSVKFTGDVWLAVRKLHITPHAPTAPGQPTPPAVASSANRPPNPSAAPADHPVDRPVDVDFDLVLHSDAAAMDVGVPLAQTDGTLTLAGSASAGNLQGLSGNIDIASATLASRQITRMKATITKAADQDIIRLGDLQALIAGGQMAGEIDLQPAPQNASGQNGPARYGIGLVIRDADVKQLTGEQGDQVQGRLTASLLLQGDVNNPYSRQGRGDIAVTGQQMYRMPLVMGLFQITSMALPISSPFNEGTARYSVQGEKVIFDNIEIRSKETLMQGNGSIAYDTHQVSMTFFVDSTWPKLPVVGDLITGARRDLLQIHVRGTLQDPQMSAGIANTFSTTIDQVFRGGSTTQPGNPDKPSAKEKRYGY